MKTRWAVTNLAVLGMYAVSVVTLGTLLTQNASAADTEVQVLVGDVCPNIPGWQPTIPSGMSFSETGDCYTPAPPPPPDACANISGHQAAIPVGYYQDKPANCVQQTKPPQDVCTNIPGTQSQVPGGMTTEANGNCGSPPVDLCPNIDGPQETLPTGMSKRDDETCYTPTRPIDTTDPDRPGKTPTSNNGSGALSFIPLFVAQTIPYYIIGSLAIVTLYLWRQNAVEAATAALLIAFLRRKQRVAKEKDLFITMSIDYTHHTVTDMLTNIEAMQPQDNPSIYEAKAGISALQTHLRALASSMRDGVQPYTTRLLTLSERSATMYKTRLFLIPVLLTILLIIIVNVTLSVVARYDLGMANLIAQTLTLVTVIGLFLAVLRARHLHHIDRKNDEERIRHEYEVDEARNVFIGHIATKLRDAMGSPGQRSPVLLSLPADAAFDENYAMLSDATSHLDELSHITIEKNTTHEKVDIHALIAESLQKHHEASTAKQLQIDNTVNAYTIEHDAKQLENIFDSLVENAITLAPEKGVISFSSSHEPHGINIHLHDATLASRALDVFRAIDADTPPVADSVSLTIFITAIKAHSIDANISSQPPSSAQASVIVTVAKAS